MKTIKLWEIGTPVLLQPVLAKFTKQFEFPDDSPHPICLFAITGPIDQQLNHKEITMIGVMNPDRVIQTAVSETFEMGMDDIANLSMHYVVLFESIDAPGKFVLLDGGDKPGLVLHEGVAVDNDIGQEVMVELLTKGLKLQIFRTGSNLTMLTKTREFLNKLKG